MLADAAYDAEHNHRLCREALGVRASIIRLNARNTGRRWPTTPYRRALRRQFPKATYHQRWHAESGFSRHKRRLGSALTTRSTPAHQRELVLRVLTHNLMILWRTWLGFQQSMPMSKAPKVSRCEAKNRKGGTCQVPPEPGTSWCRFHDQSPEARARHREMSKRGGEAKAFGNLHAVEPLVILDPTVATLDLSTAAGVRDLMAATLRALGQLPFDVRISNSIAQLATAQRATIEASDLETRLRALEQPR